MFSLSWSSESWSSPSSDAEISDYLISKTLLMDNSWVCNIDSLESITSVIFNCYEIIAYKVESKFSYIADISSFASSGMF